MFPLQILQQGRIVERGAQVATVHHAGYGTLFEVHYVLCEGAGFVGEHILDLLMFQNMHIGNTKNCYSIMYILLDPAPRSN